MSRAAYADDRPGRAGRRLFITGLGIGQICSWGSLYYSFPLIAEAMRSDLGWSKPDLYGAATMGLLLSGLVAYPVGSAIDRGHGRTIMAGASVLAGILLIAWSQVESVAGFYILLAGIGCLQAAVLTESAFAVVSRRLGAVNARGGIVTLSLWAGFASTVFIPLIQFLLDHLGWRETLMALGSVNVVLCGAIYTAVIDPGADALAFPLVFLGLMVTPPLFPAVALIAATYGAANGIMTIVRGLVVPEMLTRDAYGAINGALAVPTIVAKAAAPFGAALLWAESGSYLSVLIALLGGSLLLIIAFWVSAFLATRRDRRMSIP
jgi:hypothetical protein